MNKNKVGRPRGKRKTAKIEVLIESEIKEKFMDIVSLEGKSASGVICTMIRQYIKENGEF